MDFKHYFGKNKASDVLKFLVNFYFMKLAILFSMLMWHVTWTCTINVVLEMLLKNLGKKRFLSMLISHKINNN